MGIDNLEILCISFIGLRHREREALSMFIIAT